MLLRSLSVAPLLVVVALGGAGPVLAQANSVNPAESSALPVEEERPDFQALRPAVPGEDSAPAPVSTVPAPTQPTPTLPAASALPSAPPMAAAGAPAPVIHAPVDDEDDDNDQIDDEERLANSWLSWMLRALAVGGALVAVGALIAGGVGVLLTRNMRRAELDGRRRAAAATLALELDTRRQAFEAVPTPPNIEAGVSFVSAMISTAAIDCGFRAAQGEIFLLPPQLAANISVHYAAVQRVADFVKGQSLAAAVRMLQANRLGGHPCPDAGAMREAHVEATAAFRGVDKLIAALQAIAGR